MMLRVPASAIMWAEEMTAIASPSGKAITLARVSQLPSM